MFSDIGSIQAAGFQGFLEIRELRATKLRAVPNEMGVYMVLRPSADPPVFLQESTGGHVKEKDPTVSVDELRANWVGAPILYIGRAGAPDNTRTLRDRLSEYLAFGAGCRKAHAGGRFIWQLADSEGLVLCWRETPNDVPRDVERGLISEFRAAHDNKRPFANLQD